MPPDIVKGHCIAGAAAAPFLRWIGGFNGAAGTGTVTLNSTPGGGGPGSSQVLADALGPAIAAEGAARPSLLLLPMPAERPMAAARIRQGMP